MAEATGHDSTALDECTCMSDLDLPTPLGPAQQTSSMCGRQTSSSMIGRQTSSNVTAYDMDEARYAILLDMIENEKSERQKEIYDLRQEFRSLVLNSTDVLRVELHKEIENLRNKTRLLTPEHSFAGESTCDDAMKVVTTILLETQEVAQKEPKQQIPQPALRDVREGGIPAKTCAWTSVHAASLQSPQRRSVSPKRLGNSCCSEQSAIDQPSLNPSSPIPRPIPRGAAIAVKVPTSHAMPLGTVSSHPTSQSSSATPQAMAFSKRDVLGGPAGAYYHVRSTGILSRYSLPVRLSPPAGFHIVGTVG
eukprot:TRINITY_DN8514_c0_g2_i1.p1 TRINITY_DN8514_c0_g2~~TRINITY_DN8514_c0_g2_i1.p1  ORF type:complete len:307 (-),score=38.19 TRINITY_DN8514_c0_g2_i1:59-979(-)